MYAEIIIPLALPKNYTWMIPPSMESDVMIGMRVEVMLGANKRYAGIIKKISDVKPDGFNPKPIIDILDEEPIVYEHQLKLWEWMAEYYMCSEGEVMQAAIPSHLKISSESIFILQEEANIDIKNLSDSEYIISEALEIKKELRLIEIQTILSESLKDALYSNCSGENQLHYSSSTAKNNVLAPTKDSDLILPMKFRRPLIE